MVVLHTDSLLPTCERGGTLMVVLHADPPPPPVSLEVAECWWDSNQPLPASAEHVDQRFR